MPLPIQRDVVAESAKSESLLHLSSREVPPGGLSFKITALAERAPREAWVGPFNDSDTLLAEVNKRERANSLPLSSRAAVEDQLCQRLPPGYCRDAAQRRTTRAGTFAITVTDVLAGTRALAKWFLHGSVPTEEIVRRTYICNDCPQNLPISGCQGCAAAPLHAAMNAIVVKPLPSDAVLNACAICKCSLKAKVRMRIDDVLPGMTVAQRAALPDACWLVAPVESGRNDPRV